MKAQRGKSVIDYTTATEVIATGVVQTTVADLAFGEPTTLIKPWMKAYLAPAIDGTATGSARWHFLHLTSDQSIPTFTGNDELEDLAKDWWFSMFCPLGAGGQVTIDQYEGRSKRGFRRNDRLVIVRVTSFSGAQAMSHGLFGGFIQQTS